MTEITLDRFSTYGFAAIGQARQLSRLVDAERSWLKDAQPDTLKRYESAIKGARNIQRIAQHRFNEDTPLEANIIRRGSVAIGIATIIHNQQILHPEEGLFKGDDIDYWLQWDEDESVHFAVAESLLKTNAGRTALATIVQGHPNPASGFMMMPAVGEPANLSTGDQEDVFDVAREGQIAQLYVQPATIA
jgi:hypothetical protein